MNYKYAQKELKLSNRANNPYLYYTAKSIIEGVASNTTDKDVLTKINFHLQQLEKLENPFNSDKTVKSESSLMKLIDIVGEVESYLESLN